MSISHRGKPAWNKGLPAWNKGKKGLILNRNFFDNNPMKKSENRIKNSLLRLGKKLSEKTKKKISETHKGEKAWNWKKDRTQLSRVAKQGERRTSAYFYWRKSICMRDNWKCKISNSECKGRLEVHHILNWKDFKELRYEINNGITLCHAHHPRKRSEEVKLSPYFQKLVAEMN